MAILGCCHFIIGGDDGSSAGVVGCHIGSGMLKLREIRNCRMWIMQIVVAYGCGFNLCVVLIKESGVYNFGGVE